MPCSCPVRLGVAMKNWWPGAHQDFADLQQAMVDARTAANRNDIPAFLNACHRMDDLAQDKLQAHLPSPDDFELTADVQGEIADVHSAAHNCLAAEANAYEQFGEFTTNLDQAEKQMRGARYRE